MGKFTFKIRHLFLLTIVISLFIPACLWIQYATSTRTLAAIDLPQNKRFRLIQTTGGEPFDTKIYFDSGDGQWGFYYYEHEDWYWDDAIVQSDEDTLNVYRNGILTIQLNTRNGSCIVKRADGWEREYAAPLYYTTTLPGTARP